MKILGLDIGKNKLNYSLVELESEFKELKNGSIKISELNKIKELIKEQQVKVCIIEFTGIYTIFVAKELKECQVELYYVHSAHSDIIRKRFYKSKKNDKLDAFIIATSYLYKHLLVRFEINDFLINLTEKVREHKLLTKALSQIKQINSSDEQLFEYKNLKEALNYLEKKKKEVEKEIRQLIKTSKYNQLIKQVDGINYISLAYFIVYVKDIRRFSNKWKFLAYCGVVPQQHSSGSFNVKKTTSKHNKELKRILYMASVGLLRSKKYKEIYDKKIKEGKHHFVAITHIAKRVAKQLYREWKKLEVLNT